MQRGLWRRRVWIVMRFSFFSCVHSLFCMEKRCLIQIPIIYCLTDITLICSMLSCNANNVQLPCTVIRFHGNGDSVQLGIQVL